VADRIPIGNASGAAPLESDDVACAPPGGSSSLAAIVSDAGFHSGRRSQSSGPPVA
jgi:hypothetical protein